MIAPGPTPTPAGGVLRRPRRPRAFTLVEALIALALTAALLTASLAALDASFDSYRVNSESASTHVVSRIVAHRVLAMVRTGKDFGPYPASVLDPDENPLQSDFIEFVSFDDSSAGRRQVTRIERRVAPSGSAAPYELWYVLIDFEGSEIVSTQERPLLRGVIDAIFTLYYDRGPRLRKATFDLTVEASPDIQAIAIDGDIVPRRIRLVASASPRQMD